MSKITRYHEFYSKAMALKKENKKALVNDLRINEFLSMIEAGRKNDIVTIYLQKNAKINENYSLILEDNEVLSETKKIVCANFYEDGLKKLIKEARTYLESRNIPEEDIVLIEEGLLDSFVDWVDSKIDAGAELIKKTAKNVWNWLSEKAKEVWDSIVEDLFKPGLEALRNVSKKIFGVDVVQAIEVVAKKVVDATDEFLKKSKSVFDKVYSSLKELAKNIANAVKDIWAKIKEVLGKVWEFIKNHASSVIPGLSSKLKALKTIGDAVKPSALGEEMGILSDDIQDMKKAFTGEVEVSTENSTQNVAQTSAGNLMGESNRYSPRRKSKELINEEFIWDSMKGYMSKRNDFNTDEMVKLHEDRIYRIYEADSSDGEGETKDKIHNAESRGIKRWLGGIVMWVLSPFGKLIELASEIVVKGLCALPAWLSGKLGGLLEGVKKVVGYAAKFAAIGSIAAFVGGMAAESFALKTHLPGEWIHKAGEMIGEKGKEIIEKGKEAIEKGKEVVDKVADKVGEVGKEVISKINLKKESRIQKFESFQKVNESGGGGKGINWKALSIGAASALLGFVVSFFTHSIPGLHTAFEIISLVILIIAALGFIFKETSVGKNIAEKFPKIANIAVKLYGWAHPH